MNDRTVTIKMPSGLLDRVVDELVRTNRFQNQSEAFRYAMRFFLDFDKFQAELIKIIESLVKIKTK